MNQIFHNEPETKSIVLYFGVHGFMPVNYNEQTQKKKINDGIKYLTVVKFGEDSCPNFIVSDEIKCHVEQLNKLCDNKSIDPTEKLKIAIKECKKQYKKEIREILKNNNNIGETKNIIFIIHKE